MAYLVKNNFSETQKKATSVSDTVWGTGFEHSNLDSFSYTRLLPLPTAESSLSAFFTTRCTLRKKTLCTTQFLV